jgi:hypothetical protein
MTKQYDRKVPALLQSKASLSDSIALSVNREFIEGYVLAKNWPKYGEGNPILVSAQPVENGDGGFIKVKVVPCADQS